MTFLYEGKLNELDTSIAQMIDSNPKIITDNNIFEASRLLGVSASKLTKYCQKIRLDGFKEIKFKVEQELKREKYQKQDQKEISIEAIIQSRYHSKLDDIPLLINEATKIIIVTSLDNHSLGLYLCLKLREVSRKDVVVYVLDQKFSFEYLEGTVVTILIDEYTQMSPLLSDWFRSGNSYIHIMNEALLQTTNYYPLAVTDENTNLPFDAMVIIIFEWIRSYRQYL